MSSRFLNLTGPTASLDSTETSCQGKEPAVQSSSASPIAPVGPAVKRAAKQIRAPLTRTCVGRGTTARATGRAQVVPVLLHRPCVGGGTILKLRPGPGRPRSPPPTLCRWRDDCKATGRAQLSPFSSTDPVSVEGRIKATGRAQLSPFSSTDPVLVDGRLKATGPGPALPVLLHRPCVGRGKLHASEQAGRPPPPCVGGGND